MCMSLDRRLQLLLDEERYARVAAIAQRERRSVASVIRDAIDNHTGTMPDRRAAAWARIVDAEPMPVPSPADLRAELEELRGKGL